MTNSVSLPVGSAAIANDPMQNPIGRLTPMTANTQWSITPTKLLAKLDASEGILGEV